MDVVTVVYMVKDIKLKRLKGLMLCCKPRCIRHVTSEHLEEIQQDYLYLFTLNVSILMFTLRCFLKKSVLHMNFSTNGNPYSTRLNG